MVFNLKFHVSEFLREDESMCSVDIAFMVF